MKEDADTFASWGVDYVKLDGCYSHPNDMDRGYPEFGYWLNRVTLRKYSLQFIYVHQGWAGYPALLD